ncbi:hypothetical protein FKM82_031225 [Ascaphus truei]
MLGLPVYRIKNANGRVKVWHCNHLLSIPQMGDDEPKIPATPLDGELEQFEDNENTINETTNESTKDSMEAEKTVNETEEDPMEGPSQRGPQSHRAPLGEATGPRRTMPTRVASMSQPLDPRSRCFIPRRLFRDIYTLNWKG